MYVKSDVKSDNLGKVDSQDPQYQAIFTKGDWIEIVNQKNGQVGWIKQEMMDGNFNKMVADIDQNVSQMQLSYGATATSKNQPKVYKNFSSITINSDGKTAKIIKKN